MKIRNGFVSNSSSSSFVVMIKKSHHDQVMEKIHPFTKACIEALGFSIEKFNGEDVVVIGTLSIMDCSPWEYIDVEYNGEMPEDEDGEGNKYESLNLYIAKAEELFGKEVVVSKALDG